jgi:hypothetical protein
LPTTTEPVQALINRTWTPTLSVTGAEGFPALQDAGNVLRPYTAFKLSLRLPPLVDAAQAVQELKTLLEDNAPYQAKVTFEGGGAASGWNAPPTTPWFEQALNAASLAHFGAPCGYIGQGGTIPLMNMLSKGFPTSQMMVCGVLGPRSNAHGPERIPARALRQTFDSGRGRGHGTDAVSAHPLAARTVFHQPGIDTRRGSAMMPPDESRWHRVHAIHVHRQRWRNLAVQDWPTPEGVRQRAAVLIVHGLGEHAGRYDGLAHVLNGWGFAVRSYDQLRPWRVGRSARHHSPAEPLAGRPGDLVESTRMRNLGLPLILLVTAWAGWSRRASLRAP